MTPIVEQLQEDAVNKEFSAADLLRKAKIVATKLSLNEASEWIELELNGYHSSNSEIPEYRVLGGQPRAMEPYTGRWVPIMFPHDDEADALISKQKITDPVSELEHVLQTDGQLFVPFPAGMIATLSEVLGVEPTQMGLFVSRQAFVGILDAVRNRVLDWALKLEQAGIKGEGFSFSAREREIAHAPGVTYQINHIENFSGNIGPVSGRGAVVTHQLNAPQLRELRSLLSQINALKGQMGLDAAQAAELDERIKALDDQLSANRPDTGRVRRLLASIKNIAENASGNLVAAGIVEGIRRMFPS